MSAINLCAFGIHKLGEYTRRAYWHWGARQCEHCGRWKHLPNAKRHQKFRGMRDYPPSSANREEE